jgi:hypothetical protein
MTLVTQKESRPQEKGGDQFLKWGISSGESAGNRQFRTSAMVVVSNFWET